MGTEEIHSISLTYNGKVVGTAQFKFIEGDDYHVILEGDVDAVLKAQTAITDIFGDDSLYRCSIGPTEEEMAHRLRINGYQKPEKFIEKPFKGWNPTREL